MRINIADRVKTDLTDDEYKYLLLLEFYDAFGEEVAKVRQKLNIPLDKDGITISNFKNVPDAKLLSDEALKLIQKLNIPASLLPSIESIIQWGQILLATTSVQVFSANDLGNRKLYSQTTFGKAYPLIQINKKIGKDKFIKEIKALWNEIEDAMNIFQKVIPLPTAVKHLPVRDLEASILIYRYKKEGYKHWEIDNLLREKHNIDYQQGEEEMRRKYSQLNRILKSIGFIS